VYVCSKNTIVLQLLFLGLLTPSLAQYDLVLPSSHLQDPPGEESGTYILLAGTCFPRTSASLQRYSGRELTDPDRFVNHMVAMKYPMVARRCNIQPDLLLATTPSTTSRRVPNPCIQVLRDCGT
jgi:hypothetical protein